MDDLATSNLPSSLHLSPLGPFNDEGRGQRSEFHLTSTLLTRWSMICLRGRQNPAARVVKF